ncbi:MAG: cytochrome c oxidase subunit 3 [Acidobacteria bacterium]|nr:cytochrome c oxidase subunit 3 [Acidobacteriota bacterium]
MVATVTSTKKAVRPGASGPGKNEHGFNGGDGGDRSGPDRASLRDRYRLGMWIALAAILMMFVAFTSAYIYRQGLAGDWQPIDLPGVLWISTGLLLASSFTMEKAKRALKGGYTPGFNRWISATVLLGIGFLFGQLAAWRGLAASGIYLASNPNSSFFYLLTGAHGLHLLGGLTALGFIVFGSMRSPAPVGVAGYPARVTASGPGAGRETIVEITAMYWHFMDGLWIYLFLLLLVWR